MSDWDLRLHRALCGSANCPRCLTGGPASPLQEIYSYSSGWSLAAWPDTTRPTRVADKVPVHDGWPDDWADKLASEWGAE